MRRSLDEILQWVTQAARQRAFWAAKESEAKATFLDAFRLLNPEKAVFIVKTMEEVAGSDAKVERVSQVLAKQKTNVQIHAPDVVLGLLGERGHKILEPSAKKLWAILAKEPALLAKMIANGAITISATEYAEVRFLEKWSAALDDKSLPAQTGDVREEHDHPSADVRH